MNLNRTIAALLGAAAIILAGLSSSPSCFAEEADGNQGTPAVSSAPSQAGLELDRSGATLLLPSKGAQQPEFESPFIRSQPRPVVPFPIVLNRNVQQYVSDFLDQPQGLKLAFERSRPFLPDMVRVMKSYGVPDDLVYLSFAESSFSKRGKGPWQFGAATAKRFGLRVDRWIDERRDPILSTKAAAEYLAQLHDHADNDWRVAVVGWNMGEAYLAQYWLLEGNNYSKFEGALPRRTRQLLARFMAVTFIAHNAAAYGIGRVAYSQHPAYEVHKFGGGTQLIAVAARYRTTVERLRGLNPALLADRIPPDIKSYGIRTPIQVRASAF